MKLGIKLLAAPLLTALVVFTVGQLTLGLVSQQTSQVEQTILSQSDDYRTLSSAQEQIAQIHTGVYRNLGLIGSMDAAQLNQLRSDMAQQIAGFKRVVQGASSIAARDGESSQAVTDLAMLADRYSGQIDLAVSRSSAETGAGAGFAVMREADVTFAALASATRTLVQHVDELSEASVAAAQQRAQTIVVVLALLGLLTVIAAVWFSWRMQRSVVRSLQHSSAGQTDALLQGARWALARDDVPLVILWNWNYFSPSPADTNAPYALVRPGWRSPALAALRTLLRAQKEVQP